MRCMFLFLVLCTLCVSLFVVAEIVPPVPFFPPEPLPIKPEHVFVVGLVAKTPSSPLYGIGDPMTFAVDSMSQPNISLFVGHTYAFSSSALSPEYAAYISTSPMGNGEGQLSPHISDSETMVWTVNIQVKQRLKQSSTTTGSALVFVGALGVMNITRRVPPSELMIHPIGLLESLSLVNISTLTIEERLSFTLRNGTIVLQLNETISTNTSRLMSSSLRSNENVQLLTVVYLQAIAREAVGIPISIYG